MSHAAQGATRVVKRKSAARLKRAPRMVAEPATHAGWSTPALLRLGLYAASLSSLLLLAAVLTGAFSARNTLRTVGREAAPVMFAAERIRGTLADMDQSAVNELLSKNPDPAAFEARRQLTADAVIRTAEQLANRQGESGALHVLSLGLGSYIAQIQQARDGRKAGDQRYLEAYRRAAQVMDTEMARAADRLEGSMRDDVDGSYSTQRRTVNAVLFGVVGSTILTGFVLLCLQLFVATRMRRVLTPLLLGATITVLVFATYAVYALQRESGDFQAAREAGFDPAQALRHSRVALKTAEVAASRHKLDPAHFAAPPPQTLDSGADEKPIDKEQAFYRSIEAGFQDVSGFEVTAPLATLITLLFTLFGVLPRLREYSD